MAWINPTETSGFKKGVDRQVVEKILRTEFLRRTRSESIARLVGMARGHTGSQSSSGRGA
jgi:hypothetical protein